MTDRKRESWGDCSSWERWQPRSLRFSHHSLKWNHLFITCFKIGKYRVCNYTYMIKAVRGCLILTTHRFYLLAASCRLGTSMIVYRLVWPFLQKHLCNICASSELWILMNWTCPMCIVYQRQHLFQEFAHISCQVVTGSRKVSGKMPVATFTGVTLTSFTPLLLTRCKRGLRFCLCKGSSW